MKLPFASCGFRPNLAEILKRARLADERNEFEPSLPSQMPVPIPDLPVKPTRA